MTQVKRYYVEDGSAVREIAAPLPTREEREQEKRERAKKEARKKEVRKAQAMRQSRNFTIALCAGIVVFALFLTYYVHLQALTQEKMRTVAALQEELTELKSENVEESNRVYASSNLSTIREVAENELGMSYAGNDKIVYYTVEDNDYMSQYEDIP